MGRTVRFDQIFVTSLDAAPRETDVLSGLASIDAGEITADQIQVANLIITNKVTASVESTEFTGLTNVFRFTATQIGIGTNNPVNPFQVGEDRVIINENLEHLVAIQGNVISTNVLATNILKTENDKFFVDANASNVLKITGNTFSTNATIGTHLLVGNEAASDGSNIAVFERGNVVIRDGFLNVTGNVSITGNLAITEIPDYTSINNLVVSNAVIQMAFGNNGTYDMALLMKDADEKSNIFLGYTHDGDKMRLSRTFGGPTTATFHDILDSANTVNLHVYGDIYTQNNVGIANTTPTYSLSVGSNLYIDDTATLNDNVLHTNGFGFFEGLRIGGSGLTVGELITLDADAAIPMVVASQIQSHGFQTTGVDGNGNGVPSGIANTNSTNMLSFSDKIFINTDAANIITVLGNTATGRLITQSILVQDFIEVEGESGISSAANVIVHGDISGGDSTSNTVSLRCGPNNADGTVGANVTSIEIMGALTSHQFQSVVFKTKNTERMRVASNGYVGIANTQPSEMLTIGGNLRLNESNTAIFGNDTNYLKVSTDTINTQTTIQNRVGTGKGMNFYASTTDTMGNPKMTILENSNVGVGTATPQGLLHTSGGTVFINNQVVNRGGVSHLGAPMVVTNTAQITNTSDFQDVLQLAREGGVSGQHGVRGIFKMGKHGTGAGTSRSQLNLSLASDDYSTQDHVMTWRSNKRVGIGTTAPASHLEIITTGIGNSVTNGLLVHSEKINNAADDAIVAMRTDTTSSNAFVAFVQADGAAGDTSGYSLGVTGSTGDFRLTKNAYTINDSTTSRIFVDGTSGNIGFGTDFPRGKLEVTGNVVIGHKLTFSGVLNDEFGNSFISERLYDSDNGISELVIFKGTDSTSAAGPDRIRHIAADHLFQVYSTNTPVSGPLIDSAIRNNVNLDRAMLIGNNGKIFMGTSNPAREATLAAGTTLFINGGLEFGETQKLKFGKMDVFTSGGLVNVFDALDTSPISFKQNDIEYLRFTHEGLVGFGTSSPTSNVHIYSDSAGDIDVLKLQNPGTNSKVGLTLHTNSNYGGYVRGFSDSTHSVHGTVIGATNNGTDGDGIHVIHTSNVGIGTVNPSEHFTVYNGVSRIQHATSNAMMQFATTTSGNELAVSNIYGDVSGNVYIDPYSNELIVNSNLEVTGDLNIDGKIDLGNQVAIGLGGVEATTDLQIGGGFITGSSNVACKRYSQTFELGSIKAKMVRLLFDHSSFYARIVCMLRKRDNKSVDGTTVTAGEPTNRDQSIMILEVQGGTHDGSTSAADETITVGTKNLFGGDSDYPWNPNIVVGKKGIIIKPANVESNREYSYDIHVELMTSRGGKLKTMRNNVTDAAVDSDTGELIQTFTY
jgi:hypothetical protein